MPKAYGGIAETTRLSERSRVTPEQRQLRLRLRE
jgi:hypothetical protein